MVRRVVLLYLAVVPVVFALCLCTPAFPYSKEQLAAIHAYYNNSGARSEAAKSAGERRKEKGARLGDLRNKRDGLQKGIDDLKRKLENPELEPSERERLKADLAGREGELARTNSALDSEKKEYNRLRAEEGKINAEDATRKIEENKGRLQQYSAEQDAVMKRQNEIKESLKSPDLSPEEKKALEKEGRALDRQFSRNKSAVGRLVNESTAARGVVKEEWTAYTNNTTKMMNEKRSRVDEIDLEMSSIKDKWKTSTDLMKDPLGARMDQDRLDGLQKERNGLAGTLSNYKTEAEKTAKKTGLGVEGFGDLGAQNTKEFGFKKSQQTLGTARRMAAEGLDNSEELLSGLSSDPRYKAAIDDIRAKNPGASGKKLVDRLVETAERNKTRAYDAGMDALIAANDPERSLSMSDRKRLRDKSAGLMGNQNKWDELVNNIAMASPDAIKPAELVGNKYWATTKDAYDKASWAERAGFNVKAAAEEWKHGDISVDAFKEVVDPATGKKKMAARSGLARGLETTGKVAWDTVKNMIADPTSSLFLATTVAAKGPAPVKVGAGVVGVTAGVGALGLHTAHNLSEDFAFSPSEMGIGSKLRRDKAGGLVADLRGSDALEFNDQMGRLAGNRRPKSGFWDGVGDLALAGGKTGRDLVTGIPDMIKGGAQKMFDGNASGFERFEGFADMTMGVTAPIHGVKGFKRGLSNPGASLGEIGKTAGRALKGDLFAAPGEVASMVVGKVSKATGSVGRGIRDILNTEAPPSAPKLYWKKTDSIFGRGYERDFAQEGIQTAKARGVWSANKAAEAEIAGRTKEAEYYRGEASAAQAEIFYEAQKAIKSSPGNHRMKDMAREAQEAIEGRMPGPRAPLKKQVEVTNPYTGERLKNTPSSTSNEHILSVGKSDGKLSVRRGRPTPVEDVAGAPVKGYTPKYRELIGKLGEQYKSGRESSRRVANAIDYGDVDLAVKNVPGAKKALSEMDRLQTLSEITLPSSEKVKFTEAYTKAAGRILSEASPHRKIGSKKAPSKDFDVDEGIVDYDPVGEIDVVKNASDHTRQDFKTKDLKTEAEFLAQRFKYAGDGKESFKAPPSAKPPPWPSFEQQQAELAAEIAASGVPEPLVRVGRGPSRSRLPDPMSKEQLREASRSGELTRLRDQAKKRIGEPPPRSPTSPGLGEPFALSDRIGDKGVMPGRRQTARAPPGDRNTTEELREFVNQKLYGGSERSGRPAVSQYEFFDDPSVPMGLGSRRIVSVGGEGTAGRAAAGRASGEKNPDKSGFQNEWGQRTPRDLMEASRLRESARKGTNIDRNSPTKEEVYKPDADEHLLSIGKTTNIGLKAARQAKDPTLTTAQRRAAQKNYQSSQEKLGRWEESPDVGEVAFKARTGLEKHRPGEKLPGDILKESAKGRLDKGVRITEAVNVPDAEALPQVADGRYARTYITDYGKNVKIGKDAADAVRIKDLRRPATDRDRPGRYPGAFRDVNPDNVISVEALSGEQIAAAKEANMGFKGKSIERRARAVDDAVGGRSSKNEPLVSVGKEGTFERGAKVEPPAEKAGSTKKGKGSGLIPKETLDVIQRDYSVEQVMADHGIGKGENKKYAIRSERTPSASKLPRGNLIYDHGTGKTYNPITLEMELSGVDYATAARRLLEKRPVFATNKPLVSVGRAATEAPAPPSEVTAGQREVIAKVRDAANKQLRGAKTPDAAAARKHLADRGITPEEIAKNKLGILPEDITPEKLAKGTGLSVDQLRDAGFVAKSERTGKDYVTLKGRVTIPKGDYGMEGRTTKDATPANPKYKSLTKVPKREGGIEEIRGDEVVVTEGMFKKMALERAGAENVLATSGTTKPDRLMAELKAKGVKKVRIVSDPDKAGFEKSAELEKAARKAGLDPSRHDFAKPGDVEKGYDVERFLADGGSLEKIGLTPKKSSVGEKSPRAPPRKGDRLVSAADVSGQRRPTPDRREARVDQTVAEKQNLQKAIDDLSRAREEMMEVGSADAAARASQKIQDAKKNLITAMRDPNNKTTLTPEGIRAVNAALAEPRTLGRNAAKSRAPPVDPSGFDPYSKEAAEMQRRNPGKYGPGAAGKDAPEFTEGELSQYSKEIAALGLRTKQLRRKVETRTNVVAPRIAQEPEQPTAGRGAAYDVRTGRVQPAAEEGYRKTSNRVKEAVDKGRTPDEREAISNRIGDQIKGQREALRRRGAGLGKITEYEKLEADIRTYGLPEQLRTQIVTSNAPGEIWSGTQESLLNEIKILNSMQGSGGKSARHTHASNLAARLNQNDIDVVGAKLSSAERVILSQIQPRRAGSVGAAKANDNNVFTEDNLVRYPDGRVVREDPVTGKRTEVKRSVTTGRSARLNENQESLFSSSEDMKEYDLHSAADGALAGTKKDSLKGLRGGVTKSKNPLPEFEQRVWDEPFVYTEGERPTTLRQLARSASKKRGGEFPADVEMADFLHEQAVAYSQVRDANLPKDKIMQLSHTAAMKRLRVSDQERGQRSLDEPLRGDNLTLGGTVRSKKYDPEKTVLRRDAERRFQRVLDEIGQEVGMKVTKYDVEIIRDAVGSRPVLGNKLKAVLKDFKDFEE